MKKVFFTVLSLLIVVTAFGQLKPEEGDKGVGFRITGISNLGAFNWGLTNFAQEPIQDPLNVFMVGTRVVDDILPQEVVFFRYYLTETTALRLGLSAAMINEKQTVTTGITSNMDSEIYSWNAFSAGIGVGIEKHYASAANRIDPYGGIQGGFSLLGGINVEDMRTENSNNFSMSSTTITDYPGGWAANLDLIAGFNYFIANNFCIGAEFSFGFMMVNMGGDYTQTEETTTNDNGSVTNDFMEVTGTSKYQRIGFGVGNTTGLNASIFW